MVLRAAVMLATEKDLGNLPAELVRGLGRLANEAEVVQDFLGADLWPRFKKHVQRLPDQVVRGRSAAQIVDDELARAALFKEVGDALKSLPPAPVKDAEAVARTVRGYLQTKLAKEA